MFIEVSFQTCSSLFLEQIAQQKAGASSRVFLIFFILFQPSSQHGKASFDHFVRRVRTPARTTSLESVFIRGYPWLKCRFQVRRRFAGSPVR
jgi:hypothetical protein